MSKKFILAIHLLTFTYQSLREVIAAPYDNEDRNAIIIIPFKASQEQITKMESFKIDGETAVKQLTARMSAEKILRTLSNVPEFDILVEGLDAITLGDVYKAVFPSGILQTISDQYLRSPLVNSNEAVTVKPETVEPTIKTTQNSSDDEKVDEGVPKDAEFQYDEVDDYDDTKITNEELKEEPITDDYVYDQPVEDRFSEEREYVTREKDEIEEKVEDEDIRDSKNLNLEKNPNEVVINEELRNKELSKYGANFRNWITKFLKG